MLNQFENLCLLIGTIFNLCIFIIIIKFIYLASFVSSLFYYLYFFCLFVFVFSFLMYRLLCYFKSFCISLIIVLFLSFYLSQESSLLKDWILIFYFLSHLFLILYPYLLYSKGTFKIFLLLTNLVFKGKFWFWRLGLDYYSYHWIFSFFVICSYLRWPPFHHRMHLRLSLVLFQPGCSLLILLLLHIVQYVLMILHFLVKIIFRDMLFHVLQILCRILFSC